MLDAIRELKYSFNFRIGFKVDMDFDYQEWAALAKTDPEAFEFRRAQYIKQFLNGSGRRKQRLEGLQFKIDATRRLAHTPPMALLAISKLMSQSLSDLGDELTALEHLVRGEGAVVAPMDKEQPPCKVIPLPPRCGDLLEVLVSI